MKLFLLPLLFASAAFAQMTPNRVITSPSTGVQVGETGSYVGFHGSTPSVKVASADQTALTDSTGGSVSGATLAATAGISHLVVPVQLAAMTTSAADLVTEIVPGYKFKLLAVDFVTTTIGAGSGASQTINLEIGSTNVTGGSVNPTLAGTDTLGEVTAGTSITAANTGSATDSISVEVAAGGTVFSAGAGFLLIKIQNMDVQDNFAKSAELINALRAALVTKGLIKGSS